MRCRRGFLVFCPFLLFCSLWIGPARADESPNGIDYAVKLVGVDQVGLGSDFDGASMPDGMDDASKLPKITEARRRKSTPTSTFAKFWAAICCA